MTILTLPKNSLKYLDDNIIEIDIPDNIDICFETINFKKNKLDINSFNFFKSQELLKDYNGSLSEEVIAERRNYQ